MDFNYKNGRKRSVSYKTKAWIHLSQQGEWICGVQSLQESRLLCESVFMTVERWTSILQMVYRVFLMKLKHQFIYPNEENEFMVLNH